MSNPLLRRNHYYNPVPAYDGKEQFTGLPRLCGYELVFPEDGYIIDGMKRGARERALFKYTIAGRGLLTLNGTDIPLEPGDAMLITGPGNYTYQPHPDAEKWEFMFISFWQIPIIRMIGGIISDNGNIVRLSSDSRALKNAWSLYELFKSGDIPNPYMAAKTACDMLFELGSEGAGNAKTESGLVRKVSSYCFRNLSRDITVEELARHCGYSRFHFAKLFHAASGMPPSEYISEMKLSAALHILQHENVRIKNLAARCGFGDQGYFTRRFKAKFGVTPINFNKIGQDNTQNER